MADKNEQQQMPPQPKKGKKKKKMKGRADQLAMPPNLIK